MLRFLWRVFLLAGPDLGMALAFALTCLAPSLPGILAPADCRSIMVLGGLSILASALVGVYLEVALVFFPLVIVACLAWLIKAGVAGLSWTMLFFFGYVTCAFVNGVLAHRGYFGSARTNPSHPARRYDRMLLLYLTTGLAFLALRVAENPARWALWGTLYFALLAGADSVFAPLVDKVPQGILRGARRRLGPDVTPLIGLCASCVHVAPAIPSKKGRMVRCELSATDSRFPERPWTPVQSCEGYSAIDPPSV